MAFYYRYPPPYSTQFMNNENRYILLPHPVFVCSVYWTWCVSPFWCLQFCSGS